MRAKPGLSVYRRRKRECALPLDYERVHRLKGSHPRQRRVERRHRQRRRRACAFPPTSDGVMMGRAAYQVLAALGSRSSLSAEDAPFASPRMRCRCACSASRTSWARGCTPSPGTWPGLRASAHAPSTPSRRRRDVEHRLRRACSRAAEPGAGPASTRTSPPGDNPETVRRRTSQGLLGCTNLGLLIGGSDRRPSPACWRPGRRAR